MDKREIVLEFFEKSSRALISLFEQKQELILDGYISDDCSGVACFSEMYSFTISDIYYDIKTQQPKGLIQEWSNYVTETRKKINYQSYSIGAR